MAGREENRLFVGGLAWDTNERQLEDAFSRYGKILECVVMLDRDSGRPRGFGFITFADYRAMEDAIRDMDGRELDGRTITVNKAKPKGGEDPIFDNERDHISRGRDSYRGLEKPAGRSECFNCGRMGHFARECPSADGNDGRYFSNSRFGGGGSRGDRSGIDRYGDRFNGSHYGERERFDGRESHFGNRDRYSNEGYPTGRDRFAGGRFLEREPQNGYGKDSTYSRGPRGGDRFGSGGPDRFNRGSYRERLAPYDRPRRVPPPSYDRY